MSRRLILLDRTSKGNQVNIPEPERGFLFLRGQNYGNVNEPRDVGGNPGKSSLFLLTAQHHGI